jgi:hypothetical protein
MSSTWPLSLMQTITLPVLPKFKNNGEYGETVTATPLQMAILARLGVVNLSNRAIVVEGFGEHAFSAGPIASGPVEPARRRRRYRRRDLTAE